MRRLFAVLGGAATLAVACGNLSAADDDTTSNPAPEAGPEAATSGDDAGEDAGGDAPSDTAPPRCTSAADASLLESFSGAPLIGPTWTAEIGGAAHVIDTTTFASPPSSLGIATAPPTGVLPEPTSYLLEKQFTGPLCALSCTFLLRVSESAVAGRGIPFDVVFSNPTYSGQLWFRQEGDDAFFREDGLRGDVSFAKLAQSTWHRIRIDVPELRLFDNDVEVTLPSPPDGGAPPGPFSSVTMHIGLDTSPAAGGWSVYVDDVACSIR
jgi:hypothetical protein